MFDNDDIRDEDIRHSFDIDDKITVGFFILVLFVLGFVTFIFLWLVDLVTKGV